MSIDSANDSASSSSMKIVLIVVGVVAGVLALTCVGVVIVGSMTLGPALGQAQEAARALRSTTQLRQIEISIQAAAREAEGPVNSIGELI